MNDYLIVPKQGDSFTLKDIAQIEVKDGAMIFTAIGKVVGVVAIIPVSETFAVLETTIADSMRADLPGAKSSA